MVRQGEMSPTPTVAARDFLQEYSAVTTTSSVVLLRPLTVVNMKTVWGGCRLQHELQKTQAECTQRVRVLLAAAARSPAHLATISEKRLRSAAGIRAEARIVEDCPSISTMNIVCYNNVQITCLSAEWQKSEVQNYYPNQRFVYCSEFADGVCMLYID